MKHFHDTPWINGNVIDFGILKPEKSDYFLLVTYNDIKCLGSKIHQETSGENHTIIRN